MSDWGTRAKFGTLVPGVLVGNEDFKASLHYTLRSTCDPTNKACSAAEGAVWVDASATEMPPARADGFMGGGTEP